MKRFLAGRATSRIKRERGKNGHNMKWYLIAGKPLPTGGWLKMEPHGQSPWYLHEIPAYAHRR